MPERTPAQREAARRNGLLGGRPKATAGRAQENRIRDLARREGKNALRKVIRFWIDIVDGKVPGAQVSDRIRAGEQIANRCGLPPLAQQQIQTDLPPKMFDVPGLVPPEASQDEPGTNGDGDHDDEASGTQDATLN